MRHAFPCQTQRFIPSSNIKRPVLGAPAPYSLMSLAVEYVNPPGNIVRFTLIRSRVIFCLFRFIDSRGRLKRDRERPGLNNWTRFLTSEGEKRPFFKIHKMDIKQKRNEVRDRTRCLCDLTIYSGDLRSRSTSSFDSFHRGSVLLRRAIIFPCLI